MAWHESMCAVLMTVPGVEAVALADHSGALLAKAGAGDADALAGWAAYLGHGGIAAADVFALEQLQYITAKGKKRKAIVYSYRSCFAGIRISADASLSTVEREINAAFADHPWDGSL